MSADAINGVSKAVPPVAPVAPRPQAATAQTGAAPASPADASWVRKVGDVLGSARDAATGPTMASIAAAAVNPFSGIGGLIAQAVRVWTKASQVKTQAFLDANLTKFTPAGQAALKTLQAQGKLELVDPGWQNLRDNLDAFLKGGGATAVAETALAQLVNPEGTIAQAREHACVAAAFQLAIARDNPAQYFQMASDLATTGAAKLPNGEVIQVSAKNLAWIDAQNLAPNERQNAIFQAALMDYASGGGYDIASDLVTTKDAENTTTTMHGLRPAQARKLNDAVLQVPTLEGPGFFARMAQMVGYGSSQAEAAAESLTDAYAAAQEGGHGGVMVVVSAGSEEIELPPALRRFLPEADWRVPRFHMVLVKAIKDGQVTFVDPTGQTRTEKLEDFAKRICLDESVYVGAGGSYGTGGGSTGGRR